MQKLEEIELFGVKVTTSSEGSILKYIESKLEDSKSKTFITTPNPEIIMYARRHPEFMKILNSADIALPDGVGVSMAASLTHKGKMTRITGVDFMERLCEKVSNSAIQNSKSVVSIGLFGGVPGIAEFTAECLKKKYSGLVVSYASDTWKPHELKSKQVDILFVAMGFPKQEKWIYENLEKIPAKIVMGVGGSFDFISGKVGRAPKTVRNFGLEWLFRLVRQPWRLKRQLALVGFILLTLKETLRIASSKNT